MIGNRNAVVGKNRYPNRAALERNIVDIKVAVAVNRRGGLSQVRSETAGVELADKYF